MAGKTRKDRLYTRVQGSTGIVRYYADIRDLGGGQLALRAPGSSRATTDPDQARILLGKVLEDIKAGKMPPKTTRPKKRRGDETRLGPMAQRLIKDNPGDVTEKWQGDVERRLKRAQEWFGIETIFSASMPSMRWPSNSIRPLVGFKRPAMQRSKVVLP